MSALETSFTFRLSLADKAALSTLAKRWDCDRGAALRRLLRQSNARLTSGQFISDGQVFHIQLQEEHP